MVVADQRVNGRDGNVVLLPVYLITDLKIAFDKSADPKWIDVDVCLFDAFNHPTLKKTISNAMDKQFTPQKWWPCDPIGDKVEVRLAVHREGTYVSLGVTTFLRAEGQPEPPVKFRLQDKQAEIFANCNPAHLVLTFSSGYLGYFTEDALKATTTSASNAAATFANNLDTDKSGQTSVLLVPIGGKVNQRVAAEQLFRRTVTVDIAVNATKPINEGHLTSIISELFKGVQQDVKLNTEAHDKIITFITTNGVKATASIGTWKKVAQKYRKEAGKKESSSESKKDGRKTEDVKPNIYLNSYSSAAAADVRHTADNMSEIGASRSLDQHEIEEMMKDIEGDIPVAVLDVKQLQVLKTRAEAVLKLNWSYFTEGQVFLPISISLQEYAKKRNMPSSFIQKQSGLLAVPGLIEMANDQDPGIRLEAAQKLPMMDPSGTMVRAKLIELLADGAREVRETAAFGLGRGGYSSEQAVLVLVRALEDENGEIRQRAARGLGGVGGSSDQAVLALIGLLEDKHHPVRREAATSLGIIGTSSSRAESTTAKAFHEKAMPALVKKLLNHCDISNEAGHAIFETGPDGVRLLLAALNDKDPEVRATAANVLVVTGWAFEKAPSDALKRPEVRHELAIAIGRSAHFAVVRSHANGRRDLILSQAFIDAFIDALKEIEPKCRAEATLAWWRIISLNEYTALHHEINAYHGFIPGDKRRGKPLFSPPKQLLDALIGSLKDKDANVRDRTWMALEEMGANAPSLVIGAFLEALTDTDRSVRLRAIYSLNKLSDHAVSAAPLLETMYEKSIKNGDYEICVSTFLLLEKFGFVSKLKPGLIAALKSNYGDLRVFAGDILIKHGDVEPVVEANIDVLSNKDSSDSLVYEAQRSLARIGPRAAKAVPELTKRLKSVKQLSPGNYSGFYWGATEALGRIGPQAAPAVPELIEKLKDNDWLVSRYAARALSQIGPQAAPAVPELIKRLRDKNGNVRRDAAVVLRSIGPKASDAVHDLIDALQPGDRFTPEALFALMSISPESAYEPVEKFVAGLRSDNVNVRYNVVSEMSKWGWRGIVGLSIATNDNDLGVRIHACKLLGELGPQARSSVSSLIQAMTNDEVEYTAREALSRLGPLDASNAEAVPTLIAALKSKKWQVRECAAKALGEIGPSAMEAVLPLIEAFEDYYFFSSVATDALIKIRRE